MKCCLIRVGSDATWCVCVLQLLWRVMVVLVLCEGYTKLKRSGIATPHLITQVHFYSFFFQAILGQSLVGVAYWIITLLFVSATITSCLQASMGYVISLVYIMYTLYIYI